ncbi:MAG: metallophosphoesterase [Anaerolineaceae bacterium]|nr:metallophosphoesterase [Anaerolineaceae bacterium]
MIYITGDTHGLLDVLKFESPYFSQKKELTKQDYVIIAGDFGGIWDGGYRDEKTLDFFSQQPFTTLFVDGNHENFDLLNAYPVEEWNGGKIHKIREDIIHLMRGQIYDLQGHTYFTFGGGVSIDKSLRTEHINWWREEYSSFSEKREAMINLEKHGNNIDFIITHACPETIKNNDLARCISLRGTKCDTEHFLDTILDRVSYKTWFCGHYHTDLYFENRKMLFLYQEIVKPIEISAW